MPRIMTRIAAVAASVLLLASPVTAQEVPPGTKLVVADQSELFANLLKASGAAGEITFGLELPNFAGGPAILEAMRAGALDLAYVGDTPPIQARASGTLLPIVATVDRERSEYWLTARPGLEIGKLSDLRGKRVSYIEGSGRQAYLIEALNRAGLTLKDIQPVPLRVADLPDAIRTNAVDVAVLQEPHVTRLEKQIGASRVADPEERKLLPGTWYFYARPEALDDPAKAAAIGEFIKAAIHSVNWMNENREDWGKAYYTDYQRLAPEDTAAVLAAQAPARFQTSTEAVAHHQKLVDLLYEAGELPERFDAAGSFVASYDDLIAAER
ncbi:ABC transporter substrate-binding protein [Paracoccus denitrificans]|nr:ABC transporter substrate-binding protein [Paracoccus denitrificans]